MNIQNSILQDSNILCAYQYGSHVYGTNTKGSDLDFICVVKDKNLNCSLQSYGDVTLYTAEEFEKLINEHEISVLECLFLPKEFILKKNIDFTFDLNKEKLRHAISSKSSNSWVKAKKKFIVEEDFNPYIGKKSAWHSLRILDFGTQIAKFGQIQDYKSCNALFSQIMSCNSWDEINEKFKALYNYKASEFKLHAPKAVTQENKNKQKI